MLVFGLWIGICFLGYFFDFFEIIFVIVLLLEVESIDRSFWFGLVYNVIKIKIIIFRFILIIIL